MMSIYMYLYLYPSVFAEVFDPGAPDLGDGDGAQHPGKHVEHGAHKHEGEGPVQVVLHLDAKHCRSKDAKHSWETHVQPQVYMIGVNMCYNNCILLFGQITYKKLLLCVG